MTRRLWGHGGFTLVETLVAVAVVALVSVALQRGLLAARQVLARAEAIIASEAVARGILETRLVDLAGSPGMREGTTDGRAWAVTSEPLDVEFGPQTPRVAPPATGRQPSGEAGPSDPSTPSEASAPSAPQAIWRPLRVTISIATGSGPPLTVETIQLARAP